MGCVAYADVRPTVSESSNFCQAGQGAKAGAFVHTGGSIGSLQLHDGPLTLPVERALFYRVNESDHQYNHEPKHAAENGPRIEIINIVAVHHGPRVHEHDLDIEQNKQHRDQVEFHTESRLGITLGDHAAFVGRILSGVAFTGATQDYAGEQCHASESDRDDHLQQDWEVILYHRDVLGFRSNCCSLSCVRRNHRR
jgi:hypothetical protein